MKVFVSGSQKGGRFVEKLINGYCFSCPLIYSRMFYLLQEIYRDAPHGTTTVNKKMTYLRRLDALEERMSTLLSIDQPCANKCIMDARKFVEVSYLYVSI